MSGHKGIYRNRYCCETTWFTVSSTGMISVASRRCLRFLKRVMCFSCSNPRRAKFSVRQLSRAWPPSACPRRRGKVQLSPAPEPSGARHLSDARQRRVSPRSPMLGCRPRPASAPRVVPDSDPFRHFVRRRRQSCPAPRSAGSPPSLMALSSMLGSLRRGRLR